MLHKFLKKGDGYHTCIIMKVVTHYKIRREDMKKEKVVELDLVAFEYDTT